MVLMSRQLLGQDSLAIVMHVQMQLTRMQKMNVKIIEKVEGPKGTGWSR